MAKVEKAYTNTYSFLASDPGLAHPLKPVDVEDIEEEDDTDPDTKPKRREDNTEVTRLLDNMQACVKEGDKSMDRLSRVADDTTRKLRRKESQRAFKAVTSPEKKKG